MVILPARIDTAWYVTWAANHDKQRNQPTGPPDRVGEFSRPGLRIPAGDLVAAEMCCRLPFARRRLTPPIKNASKGRTVT